MKCSNDKKTVAVAMSGGVDSSVSACLLKQQGYNVIGLNGIMHEYGVSSAEKAAEVAKILNIPLKTLDLREQFNQIVIDYFKTSYSKGLTPNPCAVCNRKIKWGLLRDYAKEKLGAELYATGHYARIIREDGNYKLYRAGDLKKDQIYMLFSLTQQDLATTVFPLGNLTKPQIREIARNNNLPCAENPESQDICFICPPDTTKKYLTRNLGENKGDIVHVKTGKILGSHNGAYLYTIGQRKGIGIAASEPLYVTKTDTINNIVYVGFKDDLSSFEVDISDINYQQEVFENKEFKAMVKIRYNSPAKPATIFPHKNNSAVIRFNIQEYGVTPGQAAVIYDENYEYIIGGGWII